MNEDHFWQLLEDCRPAAADPDSVRHAEALTTALANGPLSGIRGFDECLSRALYRLDRDEYGDGLSGDASRYVRAAVVAAGRAEYEAVLNDPGRFRPYVRDDVWGEPLLYVADAAYRRVTGGEWERDTRHGHESYSNTAGRA